MKLMHLFWEIQLVNHLKNQFFTVSYIKFVIVSSKFLVVNISVIGKKTVFNTVTKKYTVFWLNKYEWLLVFCKKRVRLIFPRPQTSDNLVQVLYSCGLLFKIV